VQKYHRLIRAISLFSLIAGLGIAYDLLDRAPIKDIATITGKNVTHGKSTSHMVTAHGHFEYNESVDWRFFQKCNEGDTLHLELTPLLKEWKRVVLVRNGIAVDQAVGNDIWTLTTFAVFFLVIAGVSFFARASWYIDSGIWILFSLFNLLALALNIVLFCLYCGVLDKI